jgi:hypothetical protein
MTLFIATPKRRNGGPAVLASNNDCCTLWLNVEGGHVNWRWRVCDRIGFCLLIIQGQVYACCFPNSIIEGRTTAASISPASTIAPPSTGTRSSGSLICRYISRRSSGIMTLCRTQWGRSLLRRCASSRSDGSWWRPLEICRTRGIASFLIQTTCVANCSSLR